MKTRSFGIAVLDERLGGPVEGGLHALVGGPGTGKTVAALHFLNEAARHGERVAFVTQARPEDVIERAASIGIELDEEIRQGRWLLLAYQSGFKERYRRTIEPEEAFGELERLLGDEGAPDRLVIDGCGPLVGSRESDCGAELLIEMVSRLGSTALLTFAGEHPGALDGGFDFVSQRASLMLHLTLDDTGCRGMVVRKAAGPMHPLGAISFDIVDGRGIVSPTFQRRRRSDLSADVRNRVLVVDIPGDLPAELRQWLSESFELVFLTDPVDAFPELARREFGVVAIHIDRRTVDRGLHVLRQLRRAAGRPPILVLSPVDVRASDRAQALRAGADDFVSGGLNPDELASRIEALLRRGRVEPTGFVERDASQPSANGSGRSSLADLREFVRSQLRSARAPIFSFVTLRPDGGSAIHALAEHVAERTRRDAGDRVSVAGNRVEVYLQGAMASHALGFVDRVRAEPFRNIEVEVYTAPTDRERLLELVRRND